MVWKLRKFTLTLFWQKFRESNGFTNKITKYLVDLTKKIFSEDKFFTFPQSAEFPLYPVHSVEIMGILSHEFLAKIS